MSAKVTQRVYAALADKARRVLAAGHSAIADAVFAERRRARRPSRKPPATPPSTACSSPPISPTRLARVGGRAHDASDADAAVARAQEQYDLGALDWRTSRRLRQPAGHSAPRALRSVAVERKLCVGRPAAPPRRPLAAQCQNNA